MLQKQHQFFRIRSVGIQDGTGSSANLRGSIDAKCPFLKTEGIDIQIAEACFSELNHDKHGDRNEMLVRRSR